MNRQIGGLLFSGIMYYFIMQHDFIWGRFDLDGPYPRRPYTEPEDIANDRFPKIENKKRIPI